MLFDGHSDILTDVVRRRLVGETHVLERCHLARLRQGGITGATLALWVDPPHTANPARRTRALLWALGEELAECESVVLAHNAREVEAAWREGKFAFLLAAEGLAAIGEDVNALDALYDTGLRWAMLSWNEANALATGVGGDPARGLTASGKRAVQKLASLGMVLDVSHLNDRSFWDVVGSAAGPIVASHSNARALCPVPRNLDDAQLRAIAQSGGVIGLNAHHGFVHEERAQQTAENLVQHAAYIAEKIGTEHLALGFDFLEFLSTYPEDDGTPAEDADLIGLESCAKVPAFMGKLRQAGFGKEECEAIAYKNWLALVERVCG